MNFGHLVSPCSGSRLGGKWKLDVAEAFSAGISLMIECRPVDERIFSYDPRLSKVKQFVEKHFSEPVNLEIAAEVAGLEKTYFSKFFHQKTGVCFRDWLSSERVTRAIDLMRTRNLPITDVAFAVGFQDLRTFERAVEKHVGLTPRMLKERLRPPSSL